jgi:hypothetical protein
VVIDLVGIPLGRLLLCSAIEITVSACLPAEKNGSLKKWSSYVAVVEGLTTKNGLQAKECDAVNGTGNKVATMALLILLSSHKGAFLLIVTARHRRRAW